jgi:uncharacterized membrane protein/mono/diheme cytochrome c family protein
LILSIAEFIGHLHPVLVHLPIGILLLACLFLWQTRKDKHENLQGPINITLGLGMASAIASCITGYILSKVGDYDEDMIQWHQWMGISVAGVSMITFFFRRRPYLRKWQWVLATLLLLLIFITGHLGGSLTHGSDYLTRPLESSSQQEQESLQEAAAPIPNVQEALVYQDIIRPVFQAKCSRCHGPSRQKGKLRLDAPVWISKGGKDGPVILAGKSSESELIKRVLLPLGDEHHMAPKDRPQLTKNQVSLLRWWIDNGADYTKKAKDLPASPELKTILLSLENPTPDQAPGMDWVPDSPVQKADPQSLDRLKAMGVVVLPLAQNSNYLQANFVTADHPSDSTMNLLVAIKKQLVWLKLSHTPIGDSGLILLAQCDRLTRLQLDHTNITDRGLGFLRSMSGLQSLNLVGDKVTASGLRQLKDLKKLKFIYLYGTGVDQKDWHRLTEDFPGATLDSGGYSIPYLKEDTVIVKPPKMP